MAKNAGMLWRLGLVLAGLLVVLVGYYWVHKPLDLALVSALGGAALDVFAAGLVVAASGGLGRQALAWAAGAGERRVPVEMRPTLSRAERVALEGVLGLGIMGWLALALGLAGGYTGAAFWLLLAVIMVLGRRGLFGWLNDARRVIRRVMQPRALWPRFLSLLTALLLVLALVRALSPPVAFDALNYHLVGPARYLAAGRVAAQPDNFFLGFPQGMEILYGVAIGLFGRDTAAAPLHFAVGLLGLLAAGGVTRRFAGETAARLVAALLLGAQSLWLLFAWPYVDLALMAYSAAALVAAGAWRDSRSRRWLVIMGLAAGMAAGVKYTGIGLLLALAVYAAVHEPRRAVGSGLLLGFAAAAAFLPWAVKGALLYNNPVYPFLFGGLNWDALRANTFSTPGTGLVGTGREAQLLLLPLAATVFGVEGGEGFSFTAGPWLLTAPLLLLAGWRWLDAPARRLAGDCALLGLPLLGFWMAMASLSSIGAQTRLVMAALPLAAVAGAVGLDGLSRWPRRPLDLGFIVRAALVLTLLLSCVEAMRLTVQSRALPYLLGLISRDDYLAGSLGGYARIGSRLTDLPDGARVRLLWEGRTYFCPARIHCEGDLLFDHWPRALRQLGTPDAVLAAWKQSGDYLLVYAVGYDFWKDDPRFAADNTRFPDALSQQAAPLWTEAGYSLYQIP